MMQHESTLDTNQTVNEALEWAIKEYPDREALIIGDTRLTYHQFGRQVEAMAAGLSRLGIGQGENVGIILPNCLEGFLAFFALSKIGAITVPVNIRLGPHEARHILGDVEAVAVITVAEVFGRKYSPMIEGIRPGLPKLRHLIVKGGERGDGIVPLEALRTPAEPQAIPQVTASPDDVCCIFYTSGTTGVPKGAMHTHRSALAICDALLQARGRAHLEVMLAPYPLFHIGGIVILLPFFIGGKLVVMEMFDPQRALKVIEGELVQAINARFGKGLFWQGYGLTEAMWVSGATFDDPEEKQLYTVGRPSLVDAEVKIADDERREVPLGVVGEVTCRTSGMMKGYYNSPQETAKVLDEEGWLYTGDLGSLDEQGYLRLVDRKRDMIKRGAEAIFPAEIEHYLMTHPRIQMAAVIGVPSPVGGERIRAYVQPWEGAELSEAEVIEYCRGQIATYKVPQEVRIVSSLPLTATRKVQKFKLREEARKELAG